MTAHMANYWSGEHNISVITLASTGENRYALDNDVDLIALNVDGASQNISAAFVENYKRLRKIRQTIKRLAPDAVISMMAHTNVLTSLACIGLDTVTLGSERNFPGIDNTGRLWGTLRRFTYRFLDVVVTQTELGMRWIEDNTNAKKVTTIPNPVFFPLPILQPKINIPTTTDYKTILSVGRLTEQKQFHHLISTYAKIHSKHPKWKLAIAGEGNLAATLQKQVYELGLSESVTLLGRVGNVGEWYHHCDIFVMTSKTEGFPNALIEAMSHGLPVISYDCPTGPREIIENGENGLLTDLNDTDQLETQLLKLIETPQLRDKLSKKAVAIRETLAMPNIMAQWEVLIATTLENTLTKKAS